MSELGAIAQLRRSLEFGRHVGVQRVARRLRMRMRHAIRERLGSLAPPASADLALAGDAPHPLFAPRKAGLDRSGGALRFTFQNRTINMGRAPEWRAPGPGPRDQLWRMTLHYMEYLEPLDDVAFAAFVEDWIAKNAAEAPGAWRDSFSAYTLSIRVVVWMQQIARRSAGLPADFVSLAAESIVRQMRFLERNLETDIGGNHLVKDVKALIWASAFFTGTDAERWRALGLELLTQAIREQVLPDGMHYERSPSYHCQVLADLLECRHALRIDPLGGALDDCLRSMAGVAADLAHPDGEVALFNDSGLAMAYSPRECLAAFHRLLGRPPKRRRVFALESAGYFGLREGDTYFVADCGPIAPDDLVAHAHGDILSFEWSVAGKRIVVDQGVYEYNAGARRQAARGAAHHNTLSIEGADQAEFFGAFRCGRRPRAEVLRHEEMEDGFVLEGAHDGYLHLPGKPQHARRFEVAPGAISILDLVEGEPHAPVSIGFLLHPKCRVEAAGASALITSDDVKVRLDCTAPLEIEDAVWWPDMGVEIPTRRIRATLPPGKNLVIRSRLTILSEGKTA